MNSCLFNEYKQYRKRPVRVRAKQLTETTYIHTIEGTMRGNPGDWLVIGVADEMYPVKDEIFKVTYEEIGSDDEQDAKTI